ncbi:carboxypeptidase-like regulatory domain-containing protein [Tunicatimonas pelagia]|uniref:carboxypeptidase-like regulatory domain-containing protein n=1 Tax=Tunicatimonas pelagia TaxID=931531 RepID=UPI0026660BA2|nr:carboxypeptidase-like regulatory domain-containing protein [Tunicatimonas pelagia]WKN41228.1 carboxypeptidase-like regulatory domain-containing protein [Tunicatimonas pelagia]
MRLLLLTIGFCLLAFWTFAQSSPEGSIKVSGNIISGEDQPLSFATVTNLSTETGVISDEDGFFYLTFQRNDTIRISSVGFESAFIYFGDTAQANNYDLQIRMSEQTYELENVTVFAFKDVESFKRAVLALDDLSEESPKVTVPGSYDGPRREPKASPLNPVSFIASQFSRRAKYERMAREAKQDYDRRRQLSRKYNREMVGEITGLTDESLDDFMIFCRFEEDFIERSSQYDLVLAINRCYTDFSKENKN